MNAKILTVIVIFVLAGSVAGILLVGDKEVAAEGDFTIVDDRGVEFKFDSPFTKIASLGKPFTQILMELGAVDDITMVDKYGKELNTTYSEIDNIPIFVNLAISGDTTLLLEAIASAEPQVVITYYWNWSGKASDNIKAIEESGIPVLAFAISSYDDVADLVLKLGLLCGENVRAKELSDEMHVVKLEIETVVSTILESEKVKVYFELATDGQKAVNYGSVSHDLIVMAGGINVAANELESRSTYPPADDAILVWMPDIIILEERSTKSDSFYPELLEGICDSEVVRFPYGLNTYDLNLIEGLKWMAEQLYPDLFDF